MHRAAFFCFGLFEILIEEGQNFLAVFQRHEVLVAVVALRIGTQKHALRAADLDNALSQQRAVLICYHMPRVALSASGSETSRVTKRMNYE